MEGLLSTGPTPSTLYIASTEWWIVRNDNISIVSGTLGRGTVYPRGMTSCPHTGRLFLSHAWQ